MVTINHIRQQPIDIWGGGGVKIIIGISFLNKKYMSWAKRRGGVGLLYTVYMHYQMQNHFGGFEFALIF